MHCVALCKAFSGQSRRQGYARATSAGRALLTASLPVLCHAAGLFNSEKCSYCLPALASLIQPRTHGGECASCRQSLHRQHDWFMLPRRTALPHAGVMNCMKAICMCMTLSCRAHTRQAHTCASLRAKPASTTFLPTHTVRTFLPPQSSCSRLPRASMRHPGRKPPSGSQLLFTHNHSLRPALLLSAPSHPVPFIKQPCRSQAPSASGAAALRARGVWPPPGAPGSAPHGRAARGLSTPPCPPCGPPVPDHCARAVVGGGGGGPGAAGGARARTFQ